MARRKPKVAESKAEIELSHSNILAPLAGVATVDRGRQGDARVGATGPASVRIEFETCIDIGGALAEVRERVDLARAELPDDSDSRSIP